MWSFELEVNARRVAWRRVDATRRDTLTCERGFTLLPGKRAVNRTSDVFSNCASVHVIRAGFRGVQGAMALGPTSRAPPKLYFFLFVLISPVR